MKRILNWLDRATRREGVLRGVLLAAGVILALLLGFLFWRIGVLSSIAHSNSDKLASAAATARARGDALGTANDRLHSAGVPTVQPPSMIPNPRDTSVGTVPEVTGPAGAAGRGIVATRITRGHLFLTFTDGKTTDAGPVVGPQGPTGPTGAPGDDGRGITAATVSRGNLVLAFSNGTTKDVGPVVGPQGVAGPTGEEGPEGDTGEVGAPGANGRGIKAVTISSEGHLIVTYTDGTADDLGPLPRGPQGPAGPKGDKGDTGDRGPTGPAGPAGRDAGPTVAGIACSGGNLTITVTMSDGTTYTARCTGGGAAPTSTATGSAPAGPPPSSASSSSTPAPVIP